MPCTPLVQSPPACDGPSLPRGERLPSDGSPPPGGGGGHCQRNRALDCTENEWKQLLLFFGSNYN